MRDDLPRRRVMLGVGAEVDGRSCDNVLQPRRGVADRRGEHGSGGGPDLRLEPEGADVGGDGVVADHRVLHGERTRDGAPRRKGALSAVREDDRQRIASELADDAPIGVDEVDHPREVAVEGLAELLRPACPGPAEGFAHRRETGYVGEQGCRVESLLPTDGARPGVAQDVVGDVAREKREQRVAARVARGRSAGHGSS